MSHQERRRLPRTHSNVSLELYDPKGRMMIGEGRFVNLSEKGALVQSRQSLHPKEKIRLHVVSGDYSPLELSARVVWARKARPGFAYGVSFDQLTAESRS